MTQDNLLKELEELLKGVSPHQLEKTSIQTRTSRSSHISEAKVSFNIKPLPNTYKVIRIGSYDWIRYWKVHPEQQEEMLEWKKFITSQMRQAMQEEGLLEETL